MKTLWNAVCIVLFINVLALSGLAFWLKQTQRLSGDRVRQTIEIFKPTAEQEKVAKEQAAKDAEEAGKKAADHAHMESVGSGEKSMSDRLREQEDRDTIEMQRLERKKRETADLQNQLEIYKTEFAKQKLELDAKRKEFEEFRAREEKLKADADFQQAVQMYEKLPAKQAKQMFLTLLSEGKQPQVIDYLAAMQQRKASGVLKEFKSPEEIKVATELVQRLRERGVDPMAGKNTSSGESS